MGWWVRLDVTSRPAADPCTLSWCFRGLTSALVLAITASGPPPAAAAPAPASALVPEAEQAIRADYRCLGRFDAVEVTAFFFNRPPAAVVLVAGESATRLPQLPAADGARYGAADQSFRINGDQALWQLGQAPAMRCLLRKP